MSHQPSRLRRLAQLLDQVELEDAARFARRFADDLEQKTVTVLVAGEFKRGKSSLVNALIGEELLPVDIVPTTAVTHVLHHGERGLVLHWRDGRREQRPLTAGELRSLASDEAGGSVDPEQIEFAEISLPNARFADGLVLVDTPGTNDLSQMRSEVVYQMMPRADAVVFVLDGTTQLTASEKDFLTEKLLKSLAPPLCFVMNKMDRVDEDEREGLLEEGLALLKEHLALTDLTLLPASTTQHKIGVQALHRYLDGFLAGGERCLAAERKRERLVGELKALVRREVETRRKLATEGLDNLRAQLEQARAEAQTLDQRWGRFRGYLHQNGIEALEPMVRQSFRRHCEELERRFQPEIRTMPAQMFLAHLPLRLEDGFKGWLGRKVPEFTAFLDRYRAAMYQEFGQSFAQPVPSATGLSTVFGLSPEGFRVDTTIALEDLEMGSLARFGLPGAGALLGWVLLSTGPLGMIIGSVVGSLLSANLAKQKQADVQAQLTAQLPDMILQEGDRFLASVLQSLAGFLEQFADGLERTAKTLNVEAEQRLADAVRLAEGDAGSRAGRERDMAAILSQAEQI